MVDAVGFSPLALELAAARVRRGVPWRLLRDVLEQEIARLEELESPSRRRGGPASLETLATRASVITRVGPAAR